MDNQMSYLRRQASSLVKTEVNWGPQSEMRVSCKLNHLKTKLKNNWVTPAALTLLEQGARITPFVRPWSTTTITESKPEERGRSVMRSTESCLKGRETEDEIGQSGGTVGCVNLVLLASHTASDEVFDKGGETWPPKVTLKDRFGVENAHVTQEERRMDGVEESGAGRERNIHVIAKIKMSIVKQPIREAGMSEQGGTFVQSCQDLEDKGIRGRGVLDVVG